MFASKLLFSTSGLVKLSKSFSKFLSLLLIVMVYACVPVNAEQPSKKVEFVDPLSPKSSKDDALTSPLTAATLVTNSPWSTKNFFQKGMGMSCDPEAVSSDHAKLWGLQDASDWNLLSCDRGAFESGAAVRILSSPKAGPEIRSDFNVTRNGILSLGFSIRDMQAHSEKMRTLNVDSVDGITTIDLPTGAGGTYRVEEIHYRGPAHSYILGISRPEGFDPIAEIDSVSGLGGPAYTGIIANDPDAFIDFMKNVMGYEARRDIEFNSSGPGGGLVGIEKGTKVRFAQLYSPGSTSGYVIVMGMDESTKPATATPRPPSQGLTMLSFETSKYQDFLARAAKANVPNLQSLGRAGQRVATFHAPNGVLFEVAEVAGNK